MRPVRVSHSKTLVLTGGKEGEESTFRVPAGAGAQTGDLTYGSREINISVHLSSASPVKYKGKGHKDIIAKSYQALFYTVAMRCRCKIDPVIHPKPCPLFMNPS